MLSGPSVILTLKVAVLAVTIILLGSLAALAAGNYRLHGRLNFLFFGLTATALLGLEGVVRVLRPGLFDYFDEATRRLLTLHLCFAVPSAALTPAMLFTGLTHRRTVHLALATVFGILWTGTFITGIFFLPSSPP